MGRLLSQALVTWKAFSRLYGRLQDSSLSRLKIDPFVRKFGIAMEEFEDRPYRSFNDFFTRRFRTGSRTFVSTTHHLPAFAEGRYLAFNSVDETTRYPVKGLRLRVGELLGSTSQATPFLTGPLLIARLCPTDYHRFHYPDDGKTMDSWRIGGRLHSVNPVALQSEPNILLRNERRVSILQTKNFGKIAFVEIGALCVGKIVPTHADDKPFRRGDEKGYFLFGGSTVVILGETGRWKPEAELLKKTKEGLETFFKLGEKVASSTQP